MILVGFDPGLAYTGWGVIDDSAGRYHLIQYGVIETSVSRTLPERLMTISDTVAALLKRYSPEAVGMEKLFFAKNRTSAIPVAEACGVILAETARKGIPVCELTPIQIKQSVTGDGRASKEAVQIMVRRLLNLSENPRPDHAADALAAAIAAGRFSSFYTKVKNRV